MYIKQPKENKYFRYVLENFDSVVKFYKSYYFGFDFNYVYVVIFTLNIKKTTQTNLELFKVLHKKVHC